MTKYQFSLALLTSVFSVTSFSSSLQAACVTGDCIALGYTKSESECGGDIIRCPFDTSKVFCKNVTKTKICDTIGDILYDDKSCAIDVNNLDPNRTPIGVVFDVNRKLAIALEQKSSLRWALENVDIPGLTNYSSSSAAKGDYNGKSNTSIIIAHGDSNGYETPAADYAYNYSTTGTNKGDWYLPAAGELQLIYNNRTTLNTSLSKVGGKQLPSDYHWSSSEYGRYDAWDLIFNHGLWYSNFKANAFYVRPVLAY